MRIVYLADGQSPIARSWVEHFVRVGHEVHWITTSNAAPDLPLASVVVAPVGFTGQASRGRSAGPMRLLRGARALPLRVWIRHWLGPLTLSRAVRIVRQAIADLQPDLVHALRIPFEGMAAAVADPASPLLLSVWGNDFTFHAPSSPMMSRLTRRALARADGLHADCQRDLRLARHWGYPDGRPTIVLPGNGGVRPEVFYPRGHAPEDPGPRLGPVLATLPDQAPVIINPRGFRAYVRSDTFFRAIPRVLQRFPQAHFLCPAMARDPVAEGWLRRLNIETAVHLLPPLTPPEMASAFRCADVAVSPSLHDGTPNSILEAMACGCLPVVGDLESLREWIDDGVNGLLTDATDPAALAQAVVRALADPAWREQAAHHNARIIAERARYPDVMRAAEAFNHRLLG
ncbi:MAG: glycosyltransferase family 4 protein [Chloroflexota bacterium]